MICTTICILHWFWGDSSQEIGAKSNSTHFSSNEGNASMRWSPSWPVAVQWVSMQKRILFKWLSSSLTEFRSAERIALVEVNRRIPQWGVFVCRASLTVRIFSWGMYEIEKDWDRSRVFIGGGSTFTVFLGYLWFSKVYFSKVHLIIKKAGSREHVRWFVTNLWTILTHQGDHSPGWPFSLTRVTSSKSLFVSSDRRP